MLLKMAVVVISKQENDTLVFMNERIILYIVDENEI
jgi:hypothetical protein